MKTLALGLLLFTSVGALASENCFVIVEEKWSERETKVSGVATEVESKDQCESFSQDFVERYRDTLGGASKMVNVDANYKYLQTGKVSSRLNYLTSTMNIEKVITLNLEPAKELNENRVRTLSDLEVQVLNKLF